ncbi:hypothetical protein F1C15_14185 [Frigoribacterium sp. NBH87]|uniref:hypothetical protein n=1 Tax=Frigoribacterium sp. NBH87 TaxID=2596916 RepID=UPI001626ED98|nr:hypothetical protein [Frigoribacterium sp. NBH87]QNE44807.1 hypothetical protein F1C15_14185 [Frigoribacterium sp. NBH87]
MGRVLAWRLLPYLVAAGGSFAAAAVALRLWRADLSVPFFYSVDALAVGAHFKTVFETGWYEQQAFLGAPWGQQYHDFPTADNLHFMVADLLSLVTDDWATAMNTYYLVGFVLAGVTGYWFLATVGVRPVVGVVLAVLFSVAPYHFYRAEQHLWLGSYYPLPLALGVVWWVARGEPVWTARAGSGPRLLRLLTGRGAFAAVALAVMATGSTYYAVFTVVLLVFAGAASSWRHRSWRRLGGAVVTTVVVVGAVVANMLPDVLWSRENGANPSGLTRGQGEVETQSLKLAQLLMPVPGHHVDALAGVRAEYDSVYPLISENPALGLVAAVGLVTLLAVAVTSLLARRRATDVASVASGRLQALETLAGLAVVSLLFSVVGGFPTFISFFTSSLRGWNRFSIIIALLSLAAVGLVVDLLLARLAGTSRVARTDAVGATTETAGARPARPARRRLASVAGVVVAAVLLCGGFYDQTTAADIPPYAQVADEYRADAAWIDQVEDIVGAGASIVQFPYVDFPEALSESGLYYTEQLRPYLHSDDLHWSAGGIKGRPTTQWPATLSQYDGRSIMEQLAGIGFAAVHVDRSAYLDGGEAVEAELATATGGPSLVSADGTKALYLVPADLRTAAEGLDAAQRDDLLTRVADPVVTQRADGEFGVDASDPDDVVLQTLRAPSTLTLLNDRGEEARVVVRLELGTRQGATSVVVSGPGLDRPVVVPLVDGRADLDLEVTAPAGTSSLTVAGSTDDGATLIDLPGGATVGATVAVLDPELVDLDLGR